MHDEGAKTEEGLLPLRDGNCVFLVGLPRPLGCVPFRSPPGGRDCLLLFVHGLTPVADPAHGGVPPRLSGAEDKSLFGLGMGAARLARGGSRCTTKAPKHREACCPCGMAFISFWSGSDGHWAALPCEAPAGGDSPIATGVNPWKRA